MQSSLQVIIKFDRSLNAKETDEVRNRVHSGLISALLGYPISNISIDARMMGDNKPPQPSETK